MRLIFNLILTMLCISTVCLANTRDGLIGWYTLDDIGTISRDSSSFARSGTLTGTSIVPNCKVGLCKNFVSGNEIDYANSNAFYPSTSTAGTISLWFNATGVTTEQRILTFSSGGASKFCLLIGRTSGKASGFCREAGSTLVQVDSSVSLTTNTWTHLAFTGAQGSAILYVNGVNVGTNATLDSGQTFGTMGANQVQLGNFGSLPFVGMIDDVRFYNRALTPDEILQLYNSPMYLAK